jgi:nicotinate-nucleotide adenylyltransferase
VQDTSEFRERIGVFGGTFDPIHVGHLVLAVNVRHELQLDRMVLMVASQPWQKVGTRAVTPAEDRLAMVEAAVARVPGLEASRLEVDRCGPSFTADTLKELRAENADRQIFVVLGSDAAAGLAGWERADEVREGATIVVVSRPGSEREVAPAGWRCVQATSPLLDVSSTDVRERFTDGRPVDFLVTAEVLQVIRERGLYGVRG